MNVSIPPETIPPSGLFVLVIIHKYWVGLSRFKSITSQNTSQSHPIHSNTHVISITDEQGLQENDLKEASKPIGYQNSNVLRVFWREHIRSPILGSGSRASQYGPPVMSRSQLAAYTDATNVVGVAVQLNSEVVLGHGEAGEGDRSGG
jgi:hypothetical protein